MQEIVLDMGIGGNITWSPDGQWVAFLGMRPNILVGNHPEVFILDPDVGQPAQLTFDAGLKRGIVWHPNSQSIFYQDLRDFHATGKVYEVPIEGAGQPVEHHFIHEGARFFGIYPAFSISPSGEQVAYSTVDGVYVANMEGANSAQVMGLEMGQTYYLDWSPTGGQLVVIGSQDLYLVTPASGTVRTLYSQPGGVFWWPQWVADGLPVNPAHKLSVTWAQLKSIPQ